MILAVDLSAQAAEPDTVPFRPNVTLGYEVAGQVLRFLYPERKGHSLSLSFEWQPHLMAAIEAGTSGVDIKKPSHIYSSSGGFLKAGINYNLLQKRPDLKGNQIFLLMRYGFGFLTHEAPLIVINDGYWGEASVSFEKANFLAHWAEIGGGLRTRLFGNFFIGWDVRLRLMMARNHGSELNPYYIGGFGRNHNNSSVGFQYFIFYKFPVK